MKNAGPILKKMICCGIFLLGCLIPVPALFAQSVFIPESGTVYSLGRDTVSVFGNMIVGGRWGTVPGSAIRFYGDQWQNRASAIFSGKDDQKNAAGGRFYFTGTQKQSLTGGYNIHIQEGPSFPNLIIENEAGLWLQDLNDLYIRGDLHFQRGDLFLNGQNALVADSIYGYSDEAFVVTGNNIGGGSLYRRPVVSNKPLVFPVGTDADSYSPLALTAAQPSREVIGARVFDHVLEKATSGKKLDSDYVKKTWVVRNVQESPLKILLQHEDKDEGIRFTPFRDSSYISLYHPDNGRWDMDTLQHTTGKGVLTTGKVRSYAYLNDRTFPKGIPVFPEDARSWFSVSTKGHGDAVCPVIDFRLWAAQRYNGNWVQLFWRTNYELNVMQYEVQRKRDTSSIFHTIATLPSKGQNGYSNSLQYYYFSDEHPYDGFTQYRLKMISSSGCVVYTGIQQVAWGIDVNVWPNPTTGPTNIEVSGITHELILQVVDTWGQVLYHYTISNSRTLQLKALPDATYFLVFRDPKNRNKLITTVKLVVQHYRD